MLTCDLYIIIIGSFHVTGGYYGTGNSPIINQVRCYNSDSFNSCTIIHRGGFCSHGREVGVVCQDNGAGYTLIVELYHIIVSIHKSIFRSFYQKTNKKLRLLNFHYVTIII